jgi:saccharopine dehydrogenase (NADP+, L-glutamate forming)
MTSILILGAGRSSSSLIAYVQRQAMQKNWQLTVGDYTYAAAQERLLPVGYGTAIRFDINDAITSKTTIASADVVVSLMPPHLHILVAKLCLALGKHLLTASYITDDMAALDMAVRQKGLLFLNECGLDPGIDHMSAMQVMDRIRGNGGQLISFESFTGGLIAPDTDPDNPWRYKFTWNPRNVVMAGQGTAKFLFNGEYQYIPYQQLFRRLTSVEVDGVAYEGYANRDSLKYREAYGLRNIQTMLRGTLRYKGFCSAWNVLVQLGCCDDSYRMENVEGMTHRDFMAAFADHRGQSVEQSVCAALSLDSDGPEMERLRWSGLFSNEHVGLDAGSPAYILEHILSKKWTLASDDRDFIVMWHRFGYTLKGKQHIGHAYLTATGKNAMETAMARTVGLPLGIATCLLMDGDIKTRGVTIPASPDIYVPVLRELHKMSIVLREDEI